MSDSLWPHGLQHARPPCPSPTLKVYSNSRPLSRWCHPTISSSVVSFSCFQSFPASGSFPMSWLCIRWPNYWNLSFSISPSNEYSGLISFKEISHSLMVGIKLLQTIGGAIWCYPVKPKIYLPYNPGISFLGKSRETLIHVKKEISKNIHDSMFFKS